MLEITIKGAKTRFQPGDRLEGAVNWKHARPSAIWVSLLWFTSGKGTQDIGIVEMKPIESGARLGTKDFFFALPAGPYSFSGKLISLTWAVEVNAGDQAQRVEFVCAPDGREVRLPLEDLSRKHRLPRLFG